MKYLELPTLWRFDSWIVSVPISNGAVERLGKASLMNPFISNGCYDILCSCKTARPTTRASLSLNVSGLDQTVGFLGNKVELFRLEAPIALAGEPGTRKGFDSI